MKPKKSSPKKRAVASSSTKAKAATVKPKASRKTNPEKTSAAPKTPARSKAKRTRSVAKAKPSTATAPIAKAKFKAVAKPVAPVTAAARAIPAAKKKSVRGSKLALSTAPVRNVSQATKAKSVSAKSRLSKGKALETVSEPAKIKPVSVPPPVLQPPPRKAPARIPPILLEGDHTPTPVVSGPGQRYSLGPTPPVEKLESEGELPSAYGTGQLLLSARDPHWLYAHWDLTDQQQRSYNSRSVDGHLVLRIHADAVSAQPANEVHLNPESRHWFVNVARAGTKYLAELGYFSAPRKWMTIATSTPTFTPPDAMSEDNSAEFATIPFELPMAKLLSLVKEAVQENAPLAEALKEIEPERFAKIPQATISSARYEPSQPPTASVRSPRKSVIPKLTSTPPNWTPAQERALAEIISMDHVRRVWMGSMEITELIRRQVVQELAAEAAKGLAPGGEFWPTSPSPSAPAIAAPGAISSPVRAEAKPAKGFWFNINAELIIYGATEADATVTIAGRKIRLRPDGSFSYRFALPDGQYELPVVAVSADQTDGRAAELAFSRNTAIRGDVGVHPQDSQLKRPEAQSIG